MRYCQPSLRGAFQLSEKCPSRADIEDLELNKMMGPISEHIFPTMLIVCLFFKYCIVHGMNIFYNTQKPLDLVSMETHQSALEKFTFHKTDTISIEEIRTESCLS